MSGTLAQHTSGDRLLQYMLADDLTPHIAQLEASLQKDVQSVKNKNHISLIDVVKEYLSHVSFLKTTEEELHMLEKSPDARSYSINVPACKHILYEAQKNFLTTLAKFITSNKTV